MESCPVAEFKLDIETIVSDPKFSSSFSAAANSLSVFRASGAESTKEPIALLMLEDIWEDVKKSEI